MNDRYLQDMLDQVASVEKVYKAYLGELGELLEEAAALIEGRSTILTGMGASLFACYAIKPLYNGLGISVAVEDTSLMVDYGLSAITKDTTVVVVTQSGESVEAVRLVDKVRGLAKLVVVTNHEKSTVAQAADVVLPLNITDDYSVAIKTYTSTLLLLTLLAHKGKDNRSNAVEQEIETSLALMKEMIGEARGGYQEVSDIVRQADSIYLLGRGSSYSSALEGALLFKEGAKRQAEGFSAGQFRHGSIEVVEPGTCCIVFSHNGRSRSLDENLVQELSSYGAHVVLIGSKMNHVPARVKQIELNVPSEFIAPMLEIIPLQSIARSVALSRNIVPGSFRNTKPIITKE